ncbi:MAG: hypothetical protein KGL39_30595 [Patescibacteria group bacterium]|nr:hypothetical protein [Patescibacteria group bacterium]
MRLYFDARDSKMPWCLDEGEGTEERKYLIVYVRCAMKTYEDRLAPKGRPSGWIQADDAWIVEYADHSAAVEAM